MHCLTRYLRLLPLLRPRGPLLRLSPGPILSPSLNLIPGHCPSPSLGPLPEPPLRHLLGPPPGHSPIPSPGQMPVPSPRPSPIPPPSPSLGPLPSPSPSSSLSSSPGPFLRCLLELYVVVKVRLLVLFSSPGRPSAWAGLRQPFRLGRESRGTSYPKTDMEISTQRHQEHQVTDQEPKG